MSRRSALLAALPATVVLTGQAIADVTPEEVWNVYESYVEAYGIDVSASTVRNGDVLEVSDINFGITLPQGFGTIDMSMDGISLTDRGDGTVAFEYPDQSEMVFDMTIGPMGDQVSGSATVSYAITGNETIAAGTAEDLALQSTVETMSMSLTDLSFSEEPEIDASIFDINFEFSGMNSQSRIRTVDGMTTVDTQGDVGSMIYSMVFTDPETGDRFLENSGNSEGTRSTTSITIPASGINWMDFGNELRNGLSIESSSSVASSNSASLTPIEGAASEQRSSSTDVTSNIMFDADGLAISGTYGSSNFSYSMAELLPFPIEAEIEGASVDFAMPVLSTESAAPVVYAVAVDGLSVSDQIWALLDPSAVLPRDPVSLDIDLTADVRLLVDLFDFEALMPMIENEEIPAELESLTINALDASAAGATLSTTGAFDFDFTDMTTYPGMPKPIGSATLAATGVNALLDRLITIGLVSESDAMGARAGIAMIAEATGDDALETTVETTDDGQLIVNGQRMR
ncbi:DUF2125 domain-containing protein [Pelagovum pacificum]|uniref:DUF2125 domain-containing protein n=1 Tax=Pelagovum pacificum TaxID=2588711 RepID=A0A5C5GIR8_9RHOB|nr:DUF2125 domain-containing protein [Pelagovum pacificum]QQA43067.1 hypothetical protein I8N54_00370 [Pelagovum pacificum]TNY33789.1 DUF2125 domain-containing protein [Pelagovum pacificum]